MRKGTKKIRRVFTGTNEYFVYDLDEDAFGKRKRLYAKSENELVGKIRLAKEERNNTALFYKPLGSETLDYVKYYFKNAVGNIPSKDIKRLMILLDRTIKKSCIDKNIEEITYGDLELFYEKITEKFPFESVKEIDEVLRKTFVLAEREGKKVLKKFPSFTERRNNINYILSPKEYEEMISFCIADNCTRYGKNELIIIFSLFTGFKFSELKRLRETDINLEAKEMFLNGRIVPLSKECNAWLCEMNDIKALKFSSSELLFINGTGNSPSLQSIQSTLSAISKRIGLPKGITGKTICKSYIIWRLNLGESEESLCKYLNKSKRYLKEIKDENEILSYLF